MNKDFNAGLEVALSAISDMMEDYKKDHEAMEVSAETAHQIINALDTLEFVLKMKKTIQLEEL
ncbi:hypothetical protein [Jeotgalicoccus sp. WY2]|uniref:hypothetical protein n=1 Tax=Jeotgalicoccus sp. WY2 TaxID=2708346 RepID=UPI001BD42274|nr:hypothetical protein [Jeotgalicoccus sp. WY2]